MKKILWSVAVCGCVLACGFQVEAAPLKPIEKDGEIVLFDAATHRAADITKAWAKHAEGDDLTARWTSAGQGAGKYLQVNYRGRQGSAGLSFPIGKIPAPPAGMTYRGIRFDVAYAGNDIGTLSFWLRFADKTTLGMGASVERGQETILLQRSGRNWGLLQYVAMSMRAQQSVTDFSFRIKRISMVLKEKPPEKLRMLKLGPPRKTREIFPATGPIRIDGSLAEPAWRSCTGLAGFHYLKANPVHARSAPIKAAITYDKTKIYLALQSEFPTAPISNAGPTDGRVYDDEALELLFSGWNDNDQKVHFAMNQAGVIADSVREYDQALLKVVTKKERSVKHEKASRYENGVWTTEIAFPLSELGLDLNETRHMGFQLAQSYKKRPDKKLRTLAWNETDFFPDPRRFGLLVFNDRSFGPCQIEVHRVQRTATEGSTANFYLDCTIRDLPSGDYRAVCSLGVRGRSKSKETRITVDAQRELRKTFAVPAVWNEQARYTFTLTLVNADGQRYVLPVNFSNLKDMQDLFGTRLLHPRPKQIVWGKGTFAARANSLLSLPSNASARTKKTAGIFKKKFDAHTGVRLQTRAFGPTLPAKGIVLRVARSAMFEKRPAKPRREGYCLTVEPDRVLITGFDEPGLYYGMITLFQLMKNSMKIQEQMPVPCVEILDWPDLKIRSCRLFHPTLNPFWKELHGIDYLIEWVDRFMAEQKLNLFFVDLSRATQYKRRPEIGGSNRKARYSLEDLARLAQFCRDNFIELCPSWQIGGHGGWCFRSHPELREKGWKGMGNLAHPDHNRIVFDCMLDVIEAMNPKYISPKSDEYWHVKKKGEEPEPLLYGKTRAQAFLDFHVALNNWLKPKGIRMVIYHDMLSPYHNGTRYDVYKIIDRFPKDIIIAVWGAKSHPPKEFKYFSDRGFTLWTSGTGVVMPSDAETKRLISGVGQALYGLHHTGKDRQFPLLDKYVPWQSFYAVFRGADYAWNIIRDDAESTQAQIRSGRLVTVRNIFAVRPNPRAGERITPIEIGDRMTHSAGAYLKEVKPKDYAETSDPLTLPDGIRDIGFITTKFNGTAAKNVIVLRQDSDPVAMPVGAKHASLIFLHTAFINNPKARGGKVNGWPYGYPCGNYVVHYADGQKLTLPVRLARNIKRFDTSALNRATIDNRYILTLKDGNQNDVYVYQWEWVNPRPDVKITKVVAEHDRQLDVSLILFALSGRDVWEQAGINR